MNGRQPAQLLYLVIFNPTLKPSLPADDDDDLEQASILLYTAQSHAVSRDTMLRQVGLAKALINFSECVRIALVLATDISSSMIQLSPLIDCSHLKLVATMSTLRRNV